MSASNHATHAAVSGRRPAPSPGRHAVHLRAFPTGSGQAPFDFKSRLQRGALAAELRLWAACAQRAQ